jgi:GNAT superfamily N-acetyltransferase
VDDVRASPDLVRYLPDWTGGCDRGVVAETAASGPVGATWWTLLPADRPGYGFVAADIPEVSVGVVREQRGRGLGTCLLRELIGLAHQAELPGLSLSVECDNPAVRLYTRLGFVRVGSTGGADTMLLALG